jgi:ComF family protein
MPNALKCPTSLRLLADSVAAILLGPLCAACGEPLEQATRGAVCSGCWTAIAPLTPRGIEAFPPHIHAAAAIAPYAGRLRDVIQALKYDRRPTIAKHLARLMRVAGADVLDGVDALVPIPLHRSRERTRGFNQARELASHLGPPVLDVLVRTRKTATQADLPAGKRHANVRGAFASREIRGIRGIRGKVLVLVDDVATTGATLNACAEVLLDEGAAEVRALVAARAPLKSAAKPR